MNSSVGTIYGSGQKFKEESVSASFARDRKSQVDDENNISVIDF